MADGISLSENLQVASFRLAGRLFGVDLRDVREINADVSITPIYHAPESVCGYMNIRGQIHLVVDLRSEFGFDPGKTESTSRVVIFKNTVDEPFGVLVDTMEDIVEIDSQKIVDRREGEKLGEGLPQEKRKSRQGLCMGVYPLTKELLLLLDSKAILAAD
ncbi:MAG TPA: chemotaxis protein CheW [Fibrobacteraceae bacterium]|nr:chemotaxis protein CheW [Fibrobacteraceae bacterium]